MTSDCSVLGVGVEGERPRDKTGHKRAQSDTTRVFAKDKRAVKWGILVLKIRVMQYGSPSNRRRGCLPCLLLMYKSVWPAITPGKKSIKCTPQILYLAWINTWAEVIGRTSSDTYSCHTRFRAKLISCRIRLAWKWEYLFSQAALEKKKKMCDGNWNQVRIFYLPFLVGRSVKDIGIRSMVCCVYCIETLVIAIRARQKIP